MGKFAEQEKDQKKNAKPAVQQSQQQTVQRDLSDVNGPEGGMLPSDVSAKIQSMRGTGQKLSDKNLQQYSQKFGRDMSDVHVHTDAASDTISRSLNARAFTIGSDVFLTKGINPDGGGRDAQTMTHELTHVVQQGGHASAGPLKLGAADTAQEHEAESTAQREFDPKLKEDETEVQREFAPKFKSANTIQRGFWGDLGSAIAGKALDMLGIGEAMGDFMSGDKKVRAAIKKMPEDRKTNFTAVENSIKRYEEIIVPGEEQHISDLQDRMSKETDQNRLHTLQNDLGLAAQDLENRKAELQNYLQQQYDMLKQVDQTITKDDVHRYRSGKTKAFFSSVFSAIGGNILGSFESDPEKKAAAQAKGRNSINNWFASKNKQNTIGESEEDQERKAEEIKEKQKQLIDEIWNDVQQDPQLSQKYTKLLLKREISINHMSMIQESLKENEPVNDIKSSIMMLLRNSTQRQQQQQPAQQPQQQQV